LKRARSSDLEGESVAEVERRRAIQGSLQLFDCCPPVGVGVSGCSSSVIQTGKKCKAALQRPSSSWGRLQNPSEKPVVSDLLSEAVERPSCTFRLVSESLLQ
jgi:hypothetical protein